MPYVDRELSLKMSASVTSGPERVATINPATDDDENIVGLWVSGNSANMYLSKELIQECVKRLGL